MKKQPVTIGAIIYQFVLTCQIDGIKAFPNMKNDIGVWRNYTKWLVDLRNLFVLMEVEMKCISL